MPRSTVAGTTPSTRAMSRIQRREDKRESSGTGHHHCAPRDPMPKRTSNWSVVNVGFSDVKGEAHARRERENHESYVRAAFAAQEADKPYLAQATLFRSWYPHTLGRITALSHARRDQHGTNE